MSGSINTVTLLGHLGRDPDVRGFANGGKVCNLSLATSQAWTDRATGQRRERIEWHKVTIHAEGLITIAQQYLRKGSRVYVQGQLETRKWQDQSGQDRYTTEIVLRPYRGELVLLDRRPEGESGRASRDEGTRDPMLGQSQGTGYGVGARPGGGIDDDDIPFFMEWRA